MKKVIEKILVIGFGILMIGFSLYAIDAQGGQITASIENDVFMKSGGKNSDDDYSNGVRFEYLMDNQFGLAFGQSMYTPPNLEIAEDQPGQRQYAGYLYLEGNYRRTPFEFGAIQLGFIGDNSLAEETQKKVHEWIGSRDPKGWDNQIEGHGVEAQGYYKMMTYLYHNNWYYLCPQFTVSGGTVNGIFTPGLFNYFCFNYEPTFLNGLTFTETRGIEKNMSSWIPSVYLFVGADCDVVGYNYFLDAKESDVHKKYIVGEFSAGIGLQWKKFIGRFAYMLKTKEYNEQDNPANFGAATLGWIF
jgi:hypothetical protein